MSYQYRCDQCRTTSPPLATRTGIGLERDRHRDRFHGGHIPDGERILEPEPWRLAHIPPRQLLAGSIMLAVFVIAMVIRTLTL
ncbi:hypothetical protein ACH4Q7_22580 [Streptomyces roseolus]|uniref:hypothetical protein n=1 Tax=Streptomyces roseolus TaxID=67358 RepID=UPI0037AA4226